MICLEAADDVFRTEIAAMVVELAAIFIIFHYLADWGNG